MVRVLKPLSFALCFCVLSFVFPTSSSDSTCLAVTSKITRHATSSDLLKGKTKDVVIGSRGTIQLGRAWDAVADEFEDVWSINSIITAGGTVYIGTSPNGGIYKYSLGKLTKIYPTDSEKKPADQENPKPKDANEPPDANQPADTNTVKAEEHLSNEHIFAMTIDVAGRLLAAISGEKCALCRLKADKIETIYEPNDAKYIFAVAVDKDGNIYLGTGPQGKVYQLDPFGKGPQLLYDSPDKNILSLTAGPDGYVYAGSDSRGLVYKINPRTKTATVLYDSDQPEITALSFADGDLLVAATSAQMVQTEARFASRPSAGRPEPKAEKQNPAKESNGARKLKIANMGGKAAGKPTPGKAPPPKPRKPTKASHIYKITEDGFVTDLFSEVAIFFCLARQNKELLVGTGNKAQLYTVDPASEQQAVVYEDQQASQVTALAVAGDDVYLGTANPAKLIKLGAGFISEGTYTSDLIDAGQPSRWGKLQIDADIPKGCKVQVASRSGNVKDVNDPTFSDWTELTEITEPVQLRCPLGRFCQYKLVLQSKEGGESPLVREIAVASTVPNLAPRLESVTVARIAAAGKTGFFKIGYKAEDDNGDKLIYRIDFRKVGRANWIELKDELEADNFEWDGKTVEDGRYEVRVTADDQRSNTTTTKLTGSRISEAVVIDNTGPVINRYAVEKDARIVTLKLQVVDEFSAVGRLHYTVDSNAEWIAALPDDLVYDTTSEDFKIVIDQLEPGEHIIAVRISDDVGNKTYKTFEVNVAG